MNDKPKPDNVVSITSHPSFELAQIDKKFATNLIRIGYTQSEVESKKSHSMTKTTHRDKSFLEDLKDLALDTEEKHLAHINESLREKFFPRKRRYLKLREHIKDEITNRSDCPYRVKLFRLDRQATLSEEKKIFELPYVRDIQDFCNGINFHIKKQLKLNHTPLVLRIELTKPVLYTDGSNVQELVIWVDTNLLPENNI